MGTNAQASEVGCRALSDRTRLVAPQMSAIASDSPDAVKCAKYAEVTAKLLCPSCSMILGHQTLNRSSGEGVGDS